MTTNSSLHNGGPSIFGYSTQVQLTTSLIVLHLFLSYHTINLIYVTLPNGSKISSCISGSFVLYSSFTINNVLYIFTFNVNLVSVAKIIGISKLQRDLYIIKSPSYLTLCNS